MDYSFQESDSEKKKRNQLNSKGINVEKNLCIYFRLERAENLFRHKKYKSMSSR